MKVLTGIYRPTSGHVSVNGSVSALLEVGAGFHPELTGRENIRLNATILGFTGQEIDRLMDQIIEFADIGDHIDGPIKHYSSGMYVRLGFAVAVMVRPEILLVDEVIAVGDEEFQRRCYEYLFELRRAGTSMIIVSHGLGQITDLCDEAVWLEHGIVQRIGPARKVVRAYLGDINDREVARTASRPGQHAGPVDEGGQGGAGSATAEGPGASGADGRSSAIHRRGSGEIRVTHVEFLDASGNPVGVLISGQPATIRIHFTATNALDDVIFGFGLSNHDDMAVCGVNSAATGSWSVGRGKGMWTSWQTHGWRPRASTWSVPW